MSIIQSVPYPNYTTVERDALTSVPVGYKINNITTANTEEWSGAEWVSIKQVAVGIENNNIALLADADNFDVADADGNNARWTAGYFNGTEGGSADINTTVAGKAMVKATADATPTAAAYAISANNPITSKFFTIFTDVDCTLAVPAASWASCGLRISKTIWDNDNQIYIERQQSSTGVGNRITVGAIFNSSNQGEVSFTTIETSLAFKIERWNNTFRCYYSLTQSPDEVWVLLAEYDDPDNYMTDTVTYYLAAYTPGNAIGQSAQGDFDNFKLYLPLSSVIDKLNLIDDKAVNGLTGESNSLAYKVHEIEQHLHSGGRWLGATDAGGVAPGLLTSLLPFIVTSNASANTYGTAILVLDGTEDYDFSFTPVKIDPHMILIQEAEATATWKLRFANSGWDGSADTYADMAAAVAANKYTEIVIRIDSTKASAVALPIQTARMTVGSKLWVQVMKDNADAEYIHFLIGVHGYQG